MRDNDLFYGWKVIAALFVMLAFSSGLGFYNHAVMLKALVDESGLPITVVSTAVSIFFFVGGCLSRRPAMFVWPWGPA